MKRKFLYEVPIGASVAIDGIHYRVVRRSPSDHRHRICIDQRNRKHLFHQMMPVELVDV